MSDPSEPSNPWLRVRKRSGAEYDAPYTARAAAGQDIHGEASLIEKLVRSEMNQTGSAEPFRILDAGCGTGRVGIELARRGFEVVGADLDEVMLTQARSKAPALEWHLGDLSQLAFAKPFDAIVMAGNVMIFLTPGTEAATLQNMGKHLRAGGLLIAAFELTPKPWSDLTLKSYDALAQAAGLTHLARWSTWEQAAWNETDNYAVSVHGKESLVS